MGNGFLGRGFSWARLFRLSQGMSWWFLPLALGENRPQNSLMNKNFLVIIFPLLASPLATLAGGPWLVYTATISGEGSILPLNVGYDAGPQFAFTEADPDEELNLAYNPRTKRIWWKSYDGDNTSDSSTQNAWHRLSWGRQGNTFGLLYSQYEVIEASGVADHGVFFGTGTCVPWPNRGRSIGISGRFPQTIKSRCSVWMAVGRGAP